MILSKLKMIMIFLVLSTLPWFSAYFWIVSRLHYGCSVPRWTDNTPHCPSSWDAINPTVFMAHQLIYFRPQRAPPPRGSVSHPFLTWFLLHNTVCYTLWNCLLMYLLSSPLDYTFHEDRDPNLFTGGTTAPKREFIPSRNKIFKGELNFRGCIFHGYFIDHMKKLRRTNIKWVIQGHS